MSFRDKPLMVVTRITLNVAAIAAAMQVSTNETQRLMSNNGRAVSFWAPLWASQIYHLPIDEDNREHATTALDGDFGALDTARATIRTLANGAIRFQRNHRIGAGRSCSQQNLIEDIGAFDRCIVVSIAKFPVIHLYPLDAKVLLTEALAGTLTPNGIRANNFVGWVSERHRIEHRDMTMG